MPPGSDDKDNVNNKYLKNSICKNKIQPPSLKYAPLSRAGQNPQRNANLKIEILSQYVNREVTVRPLSHSSFL